MTVLTNNGSGVFGFNATIEVGNGAQTLCAADVNGDGYVDLVSANVNDDSLTVLTNNGSGVFGFNATLNLGGTPTFVTAADVNGDGHVDLISADLSSPSGTLSVLLNGSGIFGAFSGNGSGLTFLDAGNLTGSVPATS